MRDAVPSAMVQNLGRVLWDYLKLGSPLGQREAIVVFGGHDLRVADWAAQLWLEGWAPWLVLSGGLGYYTSKIWKEPEAHKFRRIALEKGVDSSAILVEDRSRNSGENVTRTREMLQSNEVALQNALCVQKPYLERRVLLTLRKQWVDCDFLMTSPPIAYANYPHPDIIDFDKLLHELVGQVDRLEKYPSLGFTERTEVPEEVLLAKTRLVELGFVNHLVPASAGNQPLGYLRTKPSKSDSSKPVTIGAVSRLSTRAR
jgi:uncharacterized SAM-binding protein YcdF (DUF218 family)